jgi:hypothetical protein
MPAKLKRKINKLNWHIFANYKFLKEQSEKNWKWLNILPKLFFICKKFKK